MPTALGKAFQAKPETALLLCQRGHIVCALEKVTVVRALACLRRGRGGLDRGGRGDRFVERVALHLEQIHLLVIDTDALALTPAHNLILFLLVDHLAVPVEKRIEPREFGVNVPPTLGHGRVGRVL